jgi:hypothetical protein
MDPIDEINQRIDEINRQIQAIIDILKIEPLVNGLNPDAG